MGTISKIIEVLRETEKQWLINYVNKHGKISFCTINDDADENDYFYPDGGEVIAFIYNDYDAMLEPCVIHEIEHLNGKVYITYSRYDEGSNSYDYYNVKWLTELDIKVGDIEYIIEQAEERRK